MYFRTALGFVLLVNFASASPKAKRSQCVPNQCYTALSSQGYLASEDCSSFLLTVVILCPATTTSTATTTFVEPMSFATQTDVINYKQISTLIESELTVLSTIEDTLTDFIQSTILETETQFSVLTIAQFDKRQVGPSPAASTPTAEPHFRRLVATSNCTATTSSGTIVPSYASACSNSAQYSSACSRYGVRGSSTTLPQSTSTITSTSSVYSLPISTLTITSINSLLFMETQTQLVPTTFETTDATLVFPLPTTITTTEVIHTTISVQPPVCNAYHFIVAGGSDVPFAGQYISADYAFGSDPPEHGGYTYFTPDNGFLWVIEPDGSVFDSNVAYPWTTTANQLSYIYYRIAIYQSVPPQSQVHCEVVPGAEVSVPSSVGTLSCTADGAPIVFDTCSGSDNMLVQGNATETSPLKAFGSTCTPIQLAAVFVQTQPC